MTRGGRSTIARRLIAAAAVLGVGIAVVGGGVAFAGDDPGSGQPVVPGVVTNYRVNVPNAPLVPAAPSDPVVVPSPVAPIAPGGGVVTADEWTWT